MNTYWGFAFPFVSIAWLVYEQVAIAAFDLGDDVLAEVFNLHFCFPLFIIEIISFDRLIYRYPPDYSIADYSSLFLQKCIHALERKFPGSARVRRLNGMQLEATGKLVQAAEIYKAILKEDETNVVRDLQKNLYALKYHIQENNIQHVRISSIRWRKYG